MITQYLLKTSMSGLFLYGLLDLYKILIQSESLLAPSLEVSYKVVFLYFILSYRPSKEGNTSLMATIVTILHIGFGFLFKSNPESGAQVIPFVLMAIGTLIFTLSIIDLGKSFDLLPAKREVVKKGMYQYVRHPMYLGYTVFFLGVVLNNFCLENILIFMAFVGVTSLRIYLEEKELSKSQSYRDLMKISRFKLIPAVY